ncbi:MAG: aldose epimerase family protein [Sphingomicrobium sp.]
MRTAIASLALLASAPAWAGSVEQVPYGALKDGTPITQTILKNENGMEVRFISYGATITDIIVPDRNGKMANVALGFGNIADWEAKNKNYGMGAIMGRYSGRIAGARFTIDGKEYPLAQNDGKNTLHGGPGGFDSRVWTVTPFKIGGAVGAILALTSPAGSQGFPANLGVHVIYSLRNDNSLEIDYDARSDAPTVINFTNHTYFNLAGAGSGSVLGQQLQIFADKRVETDAGGIPSGNYVPVAGTPFDFRNATTIGAHMRNAAVGDRGWNHTWWLNNQRGDFAKLAGRLSDPASGRVMDIVTTEPSLVAYAAGYFSGEDKGAQGVLYKRHDGIALETQHLSNAPNNASLPSTLLLPGEAFKSTTIYRFGVTK